MITDKQFDDAITAAGGWFFLTQYETIKKWNGSKSELVDLMFQAGFDKKELVVIPVCQVPYASLKTIVI